MGHSYYYALRKRRRKRRTFAARSSVLSSSLFARCHSSYPTGGLRFRTCDLRKPRRAARLVNAGPSAPSTPVVISRAMMVRPPRPLHTRHHAGAGRESPGFGTGPCHEYVVLVLPQVASSLVFWPYSHASDASSLSLPWQRHPQVEATPEDRTGRCCPSSGKSTCKD